MRVVSLHPLALGFYRDPFLFAFPGLASFVYPAPPRDEGSKRERAAQRAVPDPRWNAERDAHPLNNLGNEDGGERKGPGLEQ
ncbi:hypothetical protein PQR34_32280 [Paraburkholderia sediminicola]|uniref:hypothetical protein n=1 Tax=Paraburkholderia sediminicola TaxID=458836 RepID=UPI0038B78169